jgi:hypothetical protein
VHHISGTVSARLIRLNHATHSRHAKRQRKGRGKPATPKSEAAPSQSTQTHSTAHNTQTRTRKPPLRRGHEIEILEARGAGQGNERVRPTAMRGAACVCVQTEERSENGRVPIWQEVATPESSAAQQQAKSGSERTRRVQPTGRADAGAGSSGPATPPAWRSKGATKRKREHGSC